MHRDDKISFIEGASAVGVGQCPDPAQNIVRQSGFLEDIPSFRTCRCPQSAL